MPTRIKELVPPEIFNSEFFQPLWASLGYRDSPGGLEEWIPEGKMLEEAETAYMYMCQMPQSLAMIDIHYNHCAISQLWFHLFYLFILELHLTFLKAYSGSA